MNFRHTLHEIFGLEEPKEWVLDELQLGSINLIVGKNASGKTRSLNIINNLARLIRGEIKPNYLSSNFEASFQDSGKKYSYILHITCRQWHCDERNTKQR